MPGGFQSRLIFLLSLVTVLFFSSFACTPRPEAVGNTSVAVGQAPLKVTFTNNSINADELHWDFGDGSSATTGAQEKTVIHEYRKAGTYSATLTAFRVENPKEQAVISFAVTVAPGPLDHVSLVPSAPEVEVAQSLQFTATTSDQFDNEIPGLTFEWSASSGGIIEPTGSFRAGVAAGAFPDAVQVRVTQGANQASATANVDVIPGALDHVGLGPDSVELDIGEHESFTAKSFDQFDNEIQGLTFEWQVMGGVGTVGSDGRFTAGTRAGTFPKALQVKGSLNQVTRSTAAEVTIRPDPLRAVELEPKEATVEVMGQQQFTARSLDQYGNEIAQLAFTWNSDGPGKVDDTGHFTAGTKAGSFEDGLVVEVTDGTASARSTARVILQPGPLDQVRLDPATAVLEITNQQQFKATPLDQFGNEISDALVSWRVVSDVGAIGSDGLLKVGTKAGLFPGSVSAELVQGTNRALATAEVLIQPDPLETVRITPAHAFVKSGAKQEFSAVGLDRYGNAIPGIEFLWKATGGAINQNGLLTASGNPGRYEVRASATYGGNPASASASVAVPPTWLPAGRTVIGREWHASVLLTDVAVLIVGGNQAELYDPESGRFSEAGFMQSQRTLGFTVTLLKDGRVLMVGGGGQRGLSTAEIFDPASGNFSLTGSLNMARREHTATLLPDGKVLIVGGRTLDMAGSNQTISTSEIYDPGTGTFYPTGSLDTGRFGHTATLLADGRVLIAGGGRFLPSGSVGCLATAELYYPSTRTYTPVVDTMKSCNHHNSATLLENGKLLFVGRGNVGVGPGFVRVDCAAQLFNPATETFACPSGMTKSHLSHTATLLPNGMVLLAGGITVEAEAVN